MASQPSDNSNPERERLRQHFLTYSASDSAGHAAGWNSLWETGFVPWDRGAPNPALEDILLQRQDLIPLPTISSTNEKTKGRRRRVLIPGCGKGYDVLLFASFGFDAVGLEISRKAMKSSEQFAEDSGADERYAARNKEIGSGSVKFVYGDFFDRAWEDDVDGGVGEEGFDVVYDYTFLSALPPERRSAWALRMSQLLSRAPDASLICVEFPTYKSPSSGGPPWALPPYVYEQHLTWPGEEIEYDSDGAIVPRKLSSSGSSDGGQGNEHALMRIAHWMPERTHEIGKGTDWVSVWRHRQKCV